MSAVLPSTSVQTQPRIDRTPTREKTITLDIAGFSLPINLIKFGNNHCSLQVVGGPNDISSFQTAIHKKKGTGPKSAFSQCRAEIERELKTQIVLEGVKQRAIENEKEQLRVNDIRAGVENEVDRLIAELRASHSSSPAEENKDDIGDEFELML